MINYEIKPDVCYERMECITCTESLGVSIAFEIFHNGNNSKATLDDYIEFQKFHDDCLERNREPGFVERVVSMVDHGCSSKRVGKVCGMDKIISIFNPKSVSYT